MAGAFSKTVAPRAQEKNTAEDLKNRELYGNSSYKPTGKKGGGELMTSGADWRNPQQTYTNKKDPVFTSVGNSAANPGATPDIGRRNRKAREL